MKQWWVRYKELVAERQRVIAIEMQEAAQAVERMRLEQWQRRQAKKDLKLSRRLAGANEVHPPRLASYLASLFLSEHYREIVLGDVTEQYPAMRARLGRFQAYVHVYKQVFFSIWPLVKESVKRQSAEMLYIAGAIFMYLIIGIVFLALAIGLAVFTTPVAFPNFK